MTRCPSPAAAAAVSTAAVLLCLLAAGPAAAQQAAPLPVPAGLGGERTFPDAARRGVLQLAAGSNALLNGQAIRMAPGMRLLSPQNTLVMLHTVVGQTFQVNYLIENSTGMLLTAWILTEGEAAKPRPRPAGSPAGPVLGSDGVLRNFRAESDTPQR